MGYERHNTIIVSAQYEQDHGRGKHWAEAAHEKAEEIFNQPEGIHGAWVIVSPVIVSPVNDVRTFFIAPDGSKEGWSASDTGDERRAEFIAWLKAQRYEDLSSPLAWVEVQYGDDMGETVVVDDSDAAQREPGTAADAAEAEGTVSDSD